ncbi:hypothetical protein [Staphylococcus virus vB_SurM-PSU5]|nr:hypothetical protein [Staphylococcus virus vB_SurM-PSU5]
MIEIRLVEDYDKSQLKFILEKIRSVSPRELTYAMEAEIDTVDVNIEDVLPFKSPQEYERYSKLLDDDLWIVIFQGSYIAYYQGESYSRESLDEIIYDMFKRRGRL